MKLTNYDTKNSLPYERYYVDGAVQLKINNNEKLLNTLEQLFLGNVKNLYQFDTVLNSHSLRPKVYDYDSSILDFIFDNDLPQQLNLHSKKRLTMNHIQIVKTDPGRSYQDWHRDSYQHYPGNWVGVSPPGHKIIFYPRFNNVSEPRLRYIKGSHRCALNTAHGDNMLISQFEHDVIHSTNDSVLMFETSILHAVIPDVNPLGSIRIIYNFVDEDQYQRIYSSKEHHKILHDIYESRLQK